MKQFQIRPPSRHEGDKIVRELRSFGYTRSSDDIDDADSREWIDMHHDQYPVIMCREDGSITNANVLTANYCLDEFPEVSMESVIRGEL